MNLEKVDVLAVAPHPDDIEMTCGGTMLKLRKLGYSTAIADLTEGELGTRGTRKLRKKESEKAAELLDLTFRINLDFGDGSVINNEKNRNELIKLIRACKPQIIFAPIWLDDHPDHVQTGLICKDAFYLSGLRNYLPDYEYHKPKQIMYYMCREEFEPTMIIDITDEFTEKIDIIKLYSSQLYSEESNEPETSLSKPGFLEYLASRSRIYGRMINKEHGEPFYTKYAPEVEDPVKIWK